MSIKSPVKINGNVDEKIGKVGNVDGEIGKKLEM